AATFTRGAQLAGARIAPDHQAQHRLAVGWRRRARSPHVRQVLRQRADSAPVGVAEIDPLLASDTLVLSLELLEGTRIRCPSGSAPRSAACTARCSRSERRAGPTTTCSSRPTG